MLSPLRFLVIMDAVARRAINNWSRGPWTMLILNRCRDMQYKANVQAAELYKVGLRINAKKTKEMRINQVKYSPDL